MSIARQISSGKCLGLHFDRRDKWREGIASVSWSANEGYADARGDPWTLKMQLGVQRYGAEMCEHQNLSVSMPPGCAPCPNPS